MADMVERAKQWKLTTAREEDRARRAAKKLGLSVRKLRRRQNRSAIYTVVEPLSGAVVHDFLLSPSDVVSFCKDFSRLRRH